MGEELIPIGKIVKCQGKKGQIRLFPFIQNLSLNEGVGEIYTIDSSGTASKRKATSIKPHKKLWIIHFEGINSISEAQFLISQDVAVYDNFFQKLPPGNYYWYEIIGLEVYDEENNFLGKVKDIFSTGSNDVYVVKSKEAKEFLLPATKEIVKRIDLKENKITIHMVDGLSE